MKRSAAVSLLLTLGGCFGHAPTPPARPHYVLGGAYEADGAWYYPSARYAGEETGLAMIEGARLDGTLTADGEAFDPTALAAAHQTLQLPAIARLTNLETGSQAVVRINDRGPARPDRFLAVTPRAAALLRFPSGGVARVRLELLPAEGHAAVDALGGAPEERIAIAPAPREAVLAADLPSAGMPARAAGPVPAAKAVIAPAIAPPPLRLPEQVAQVPPEPGALWIDLGRFSQLSSARLQARRAPALAPAIERERRGREEAYHVHAGPFATVAAADAAFARARRAGVSDARIVVE